MKIAVSANAPSLDADVDPRFGRCPYFLIVDTDDFTFEVFENPYVSLGRGAGTQCAQLIAEKGTQVAITGNCGPNAFQVLSAAAIEVVVGCSGGARQVVRQFVDGQLSAGSAPNVTGHTEAQKPPTSNGSLPPEQSTLRGSGRGQGRGGGSGRGRRRGPGRRRGATVQAGTRGLCIPPPHGADPLL